MDAFGRKEWCVRGTTNICGQLWCVVLTVYKMDLKCRRTNGIFCHNNSDAMSFCTYEWGQRWHKQLKFKSASFVLENL